MMIDSWEAGMQNWTDDMIARVPEAARLRSDAVSAGADRARRRERRAERPLPVGLPPHDGRPGRRQPLRRHGGACSGSRGWASTPRRPGVSLEILEDTLLNKSKVDIPMGEFWMRPISTPESMYVVDVRGAASAAHVYGKTLVAAEAFTGGGYDAPYGLQEARRLLVRPGRQPHRLPFLGTSAARHQARQHHGRHALQPQHHLGGAGRAVHDLPGAHQLHAAAGALRGRHRLSAERRRAVDHAVLGRRRCSRRRPTATTTTT